MYQQQIHCSNTHVSTADTLFQYTCINSRYIVLIHMYLLIITLEMQLPPKSTVINHQNFGSDYYFYYCCCFVLLSLSFFSYRVE